jgi:hypothetical protein
MRRAASSLDCVEGSGVEVGGSLSIRAMKRCGVDCLGLKAIVGKLEAGISR